MYFTEGIQEQNIEEVEAGTSRFYIISAHLTCKFFLVFGVINDYLNIYYIYNYFLLFLIFELKFFMIL